MQHWPWPASTARTGLPRCARWGATWKDEQTGIVRQDYDKVHRLPHVIAWPPAPYTGVRSFKLGGADYADFALGDADTINTKQYRGEVHLLHPAREACGEQPACGPTPSVVPATSATWTIRTPEVSRLLASREYIAAAHRVRHQALCLLSRLGREYAERCEREARWPHRGLTIGIIACAVVAVVGIALWMVQLSGGMIQTGMRNSLDSWGFYITLFMFFVGLSAGGLIISSIPNAFGSMKGFGDISRVAIWTSICCTCVAIGFVVVDLGGPLRLWELFVYSNLSSPLMWDIIVLSTYLISIVYLWAYRREDEGKMSPPSASSPSLLWWWRWACTR